MTRQSSVARAAEAPYAGVTYWDAEAPTMSEAVFQRHVIREAEALGYWCYHPHDSRRSAEGYPDLTCFRPAGCTPDGQRVSGRVIFIELKAEKRGKLTDAQRARRELLRLAGAEIYSPVKPSNFDRLLAILAATGGPT